MRKDAITLYINGSLFIIKKNSLKKVKDEKECYGTACLYVDNYTDKSDIISFIKVYEDNIDNQFIDSEVKEYMGNIKKKIIIDNEEKICFALNKEFLINIFEKYRFEKIYPIHYVMKKLNEGYSGFISEEIIYLQELFSTTNITSEYLLRFSTNKEEYIQTDKDLEFCENLGETIFTDYTEEVKIFYPYDSLSFDQYVTKLSLEDLIAHLNTIDLFIEDKVSKIYKKKVVHKYLWYSDIVLVSLAVLLGYSFLKTSVEESFYQNKNEKLQSELVKVKQNVKKLNEQLPNIKFSTFKLNEGIKLLEKYISYNPNKYVYSFNEKNNMMELELEIKGINDTEALLNMLQKNKIKFTYDKQRGYVFRFKIQERLK